MGLPHLLMAGGTLLLVVGCIGYALQKNVRVTSDPEKAEIPTSPPSSAS
jgi:hypothetical protein